MWVNMYLRTSLLNLLLTKQRLKMSERTNKGTVFHILGKEQTGRGGCSTLGYKN